VDLVAAEDTRVTGRLLEHAGVRARKLSYRDQNEQARTPELVRRLLAGENIALVSDAGTPSISDPGYRLVRAAAEAGIEVVAVAGPSAVVALLSVAGLATDRFSFEGFAPSRKVARRKEFQSWRAAGRTVVFYESPHRMVVALGDLAEVLDDPPVAVGRELTKRHEEVLRGRASEVAAAIQAKGARGEFVVAVSVAAEAADLGAETVAEQVRRLHEQGLSARDIAAELKPLGAARRDVYRLVQELGARGGEEP
jgi:16S rRNA (cytidine1402-2'-O)-methyltransferase